MPRKSAAARMTPLLTERSRLQPPSGLSRHERRIFRDVVASLSPEHLKAEDAPLVALYARGLAQCEQAAREIASGSTERFWLELQAAGLKIVNAMAVRLRIGAKARAPSNQRKPGSAQSHLPPPWAGNRFVSPLRAAPREEGSERNFADLLAQTRGRRGADRASPRRDIATFTATEAADIAAFVNASTTSGTLVANEAAEGTQ